MADNTPLNSSLRKTTATASSSVSRAALDRRRQRSQRSAASSTTTPSTLASTSTNDPPSSSLQNQQRQQQNVHDGHEWSGSAIPPRARESAPLAWSSTSSSRRSALPTTTTTTTMSNLSSKESTHSSKAKASGKSTSFSLQTSREAGEAAAAVLGKYKGEAAKHSSVDHRGSTRALTSATSTQYSASTKRQPVESREDKFLMQRLGSMSSPSTTSQKEASVSYPTYKSSNDSNLSHHDQEEEEVDTTTTRYTSRSASTEESMTQRVGRYPAGTDTVLASKQRRTVAWKEDNLATASRDAVLPKQTTGGETKRPTKYTTHAPKPSVEKYSRDNELFEEDVVMVPPDSTEANEDPNTIQTLEDVEPVVERIHVDAACLESESAMCLQRYHVHNLNDESYRARNDESSLGAPLCVVLRGVNWTAPVLCYGAHIQLCVLPNNDNSLSQREQCVGVMEATNQVCLVNLPQEEEEMSTCLVWQVFRGDSPKHVLQVGPSVAQTEGISATTSMAAPIHQGEPILLRNVFTGGLLSLSEVGLHILTDAYQQEEEPPLDWFDNRMLPKGHELTLNRLRDHNIIIPSMNEIFTFVSDRVPCTTAWMHGGLCASRKYVLNNFLRFPNRFSEESDTPDMAIGMEGARVHEQQSRKGQEQLLVEELLGAFLGLEGTVVKTKVVGRNDSSVLRGQQIRFYLDVNQNENCINLDRGLWSLVEGLMLPLADNFVLVQEFVAKRMDRFEYGSVMQALCTALDNMIEDYTQAMFGIKNDYLRTRGMALRELQVVCQPLLEKMVVLAMVARSCANNKGGALINGLRLLLVHQYQGNAVAETTIHVLLEEASKPFMTMLESWLSNGILEDPYNEFMIEHDEVASWEGRYKLNHRNTLQHFFPTTVEAERVLLAGKYWNAVRACSKDVAVGSLPVLNIKYHANSAQVASQIQTSYHSASQSLVRLLIDDCDLVGTLRLLKRYFLLDQGDFFLNFLDAAEEELARDPSKLRQFRAQHLLQLSVQITENGSGEEIPVAQQHLRLSPADLTCRFAPDSLVDQLDRIHAASGGLNTNDPITPQRLVYTGQGNPTRTGVDLFLLEFCKIPFPLSLILSESCLSTYRLLFRHLFFAKHVERRLVAVWQDHLSMKEFPSIRGMMGATYLLRQRMIHFAQNMIYYMMFEVIEPNWLELMTKITSTTKEQTVDEIISVHAAFLDRTMEACLLTNRDFVLAFTRVMQTCLLFSMQMETFIKKVRLHQDRQQLAMENRNRIQRNIHAQGGGLKRSSKIHKEIYAERQKRIQEQTRRLEREVSSHEFQRMIAHYESTFTKHLRAFMSILTKSEDKLHTEKVNLCIRLDYNGFVTSSMGIKTTG